MLKFLQFINLNEGGNVTVQYQGKTVSADPINLETTPRHNVTTGIKHFLSALHDHIQKHTGEHLFGKNKVALEHGTIFGGSTRPMMDSTITDHEYIHKMGKKTVGDIDTMVRPEHVSKGGVLEHALQPGSKFGDFTVMGFKHIGTSGHAIVRNDKTGDHHQIDFAGVEYEGDHPSKFSQVAYGSPREDMLKGLKGADKTAMLTAAIKGASGFNGKVVNKKGKVEEEGYLPHRTFSIAKGMRDSHIDLGNGLAQKITPAKSKTPLRYTTDLEEISKKTFGVPHAEVDSFHGVVRSMKEHFNNEQIGRTIDILKKSMEEENNPRIPIAMSILQKHFGKTHPEHFK